MVRVSGTTDVITERMKAAFRDIMDLCNTDPCTYRADTPGEDWQRLLDRIDDIAHRGLYGDWHRGLYGD